MADNRPAPEDRKARYLAPLAIAAVVAAVLIVVVAKQSPAPSPVAAPAPAPIQAVAPPPAPEIVPLPLTRAELVDHARALAAKFAATAKMPATPDPFVGRRFSLRIAFGCNGISGSAPGAQTSLIYDSQSQSVTLAARPGDWTSLPLVQSLSNAAGIESVEGFWLPRTWMDADICPAPSGNLAPATQTPPTAPALGLAQLFAANDSRVARHTEHPYEFTRKIPTSAPDLLNHSYRLLLEGSISGFADQQALQCWSESPDHQPLCLYGVTLDNVAFVDGQTGEVLAKWAD